MFATFLFLYQYLHSVWKKFIILEMTDKIAVIAGQMPTMANLLLSTERPIVNHSHYEDAGLRERTKKVYTVFSRKIPYEVYKNLVSLKVEYLILSAPWCLTTTRGGCALTEVWDIEEPDLKHSEPSKLCDPLKVPT